MTTIRVRPKKKRKAWQDADDLRAIGVLMSIRSRHNAQKKGVLHDVPKNIASATLSKTSYLGCFPPLPLPGVMPNS